jgi:hypothetical protein
VNNALISVVYADEASPPSAMQDVSEEPGTLGAILTIDNPENSLIRLVVELSETLYYAETTAVFVDYRTSFPRDNFSTQ